MKKTLCYCDRCGSKDALTVSVFIDRTMDAAGSMDNIYEDIDLCHVCSVIALKGQLNGRANVQGEVPRGADFIRAYTGKAGKE